MSLKGTGQFEQIEIKVYLCDMCGKEMDGKTDRGQGVSMHFGFGYHSHRDGDNWDWEFCDSCADSIAKLLEAMRINNGMAKLKPNNFLGIMNEEPQGAD